MNIKECLVKKHTDLGLLILRVGLGFMFVLHGWPKIQGGTATWERLGGAMANLGLSFAPVFWGLMAALSEFGGGLLLILGLFTKPASTLMAFTMLIATLMHHNAGDNFMHQTSRPLELMIVFVAIMMLGPGKFSLDAKVFRREFLDS